MSIVLQTSIHCYPAMQKRLPGYSARFSFPCINRQTDNSTVEAHQPFAGQVDLLGHLPASCHRRCLALLTPSLGVQTGPSQVCSLLAGTQE